YTVHARHMARVMVAAGCARGKVGGLMTKIAGIFGVKIDKKRSMSARTVGRAILEGGIAARMQSTHELSLNEALGIEGVNYEARKLQHRVPDYKTNPLWVDPSSTPRIREAGVHSMLDHSSAESVAGWKHSLEANAAIYNESPLARRLQ
ncbi:hypothetical protein C8J57DRAFT_952622, partial [Mycena rebaudengoi]